VKLSCGKVSAVVQTRCYKFSFGIFNKLIIFIQHLLRAIVFQIPPQRKCENVSQNFIDTKMKTLLTDYAKQELKSALQNPTAK
jgi:hypothetical protein